MFRNAVAEQIFGLTAFHVVVMLVIIPLAASLVSWAETSLLILETTPVTSKQAMISFQLF